MTQEDKELLLKDLCARLPYGVMISLGPYDKNPISVNSISIVDIGTFLNGYFTKGIQLDFNGKKELWPKSYLRPMSSMTKEECIALSKLIPYEIDAWKYIKTPVPLYIANIEQFDFFHRHHLDWRGLIPKGLALEAQEGMYK